MRIPPLPVRIDGAQWTASRSWEKAATVQLSAAEVVVGAGLVFGRDFGWLEGQTVLEGYADRLTARPAYAAAMEG